MSRIFGGIKQIGIVVRDFDRCVAQWLDTYGVGPFFIVRRMRFEDFSYRGRPTLSPLVTLGFSYAGDVQIEIIQQDDDTPSGYLDFLASGREGFQHVSAQYEEMADYHAAYEGALAKGHRVLQEGKMGPARFAYFDTCEPPMGMSYEMSGGLAQMAPVISHIKQAAASWNGEHPLRDLATFEPI